MRDRNGVAHESLVPVAHARRHRLVAFAAGRNKMPLVVLTRCDALRIACMQLRDRETFPIAESNFGEPRLDAIAARGKAERRAQELHGRAGAAERARHKVQFGHIAAVAREPLPQDFTAMHGLAASARVERHVTPALQPTGHVPVGFTVANIKDGWPRLPTLTHQSVLPTARSGASGCLMPMI